jgi:GT2 family glycosyltransferase
VQVHDSAGERGAEPAISVVIATVGRAEKLGRSLAAFNRLDTETPAFEVIVVLDGDDPAMRALAQEPHRFPLHVLEQPHQGNGPAKNLGARHALAPYLLFLNDDTRPDPGCLIAHLRAQERHGPCVLLGKVEWDPDREVTPYMAWLAPAGHQFNFSRLAAREPVSWDAIWGAHVGLPRAWHLEDPFDAAFPYPSMEDSEWGFRLIAKGRPARYEPDAVCYHDHRYDGPADYRPRARISGAATRYAVQNHPRLLWPLILRPAAAALATSLLALWPGRWRRDTAWDLDFRWNYVWGLVSRQRRARLHPGRDDV